MAFDAPAGFKALVSVGGEPLPEPSFYDGVTSTIVDSGRNLDGMMIGSVIRDKVSKVSIKWRYLTVYEWAFINGRFSGAEKFINPVEFFDQTEGTWVTKKMYVGDRKAGAWRRDPDTGALLGWTDCSLSLIEV